MRGVEAKLQEDPAALVIGTGGQPVLEHVGRPRLVGRRSRALGHKNHLLSGWIIARKEGRGKEVIGVTLISGAQLVMTAASIVSMVAAILACREDAVMTSIAIAVVPFLMLAAQIMLLTFAK